MRAQGAGLILCNWRPEILDGLGLNSRVRALTSKRTWLPESLEALEGLGRNSRVKALRPKRTWLPEILEAVCIAALGALAAAPLLIKLVARPRLVERVGTQRWRPCPQARNRAQGLGFCPEAQRF